MFGLRHPSRCLREEEDEMYRALILLIDLLDNCDIYSIYRELGYQNRIVDSLLI